MTELNFSGIAADREERKLHVFFHVHWPPAAVRPAQRKTPGLEKVTSANSHTGQSQRSVHTRWRWLTPAVLPFATPLVALEAQPPLLRIWLKCREASALAKTAANASQFPLLRRLKSVLFLIASHQRIIAPLRKREDWEALKENYWAVQKKEQTKTQQLICEWIKRLWLWWLLVAPTFCSSSTQCFQFVKKNDTFILPSSSTSHFHPGQTTNKARFVCLLPLKTCVAAVEALIPFRLLK